MLDPNYLLHISEGAEDISEKLHNDIVSRIVERVMLRIGRGEDYLLTAQDKWQIENLQQAGYLLEDIQKEIAKATKLQQTEIAEAMEDAGVKALDYDDKIYRDAGLSPKQLTQSPELIRLMQRNYEATLGEWSNFTRTTAESAQRLFLSELDHAYNLVSTGALSYMQAVKEVINHIVSDGVKVTYPTGHSDTIETATLRAVRTGISQATGQIQTARMDEMGVDLVITSSHLGARPTHQTWQGMVFSRSGRNPKYLPFIQATGYGTVSGLCGANCRHSFGPYFEGMDNPFEQYKSKENQEQYEKEQRQRTLERRIRDSKREVLGLKQSLDNCEDEALREVLDREYQRKSALLAKQNKAYSDYCEKNGLKPLQDRVQIAQWNRKQAAAARGAAKRYENAKSNVETQYLHNNLPKKYNDIRKVGKAISDEDLLVFKQKADSYGIRTIGFENYRGDVKVLNEVLDHINESKAHFILKNVKTEKIILNYDNVLGYMGDNSKIDIGAFAETKGKTITLNKFMFDDSKYLKKEYKSAVEKGIFAKGTSYVNIIDHEYGHIIIKNNHGLYNKILDVIEEMAYNKGEEIPVFIRKNVSVYAKELNAQGDYSELIAELYSMAQGKENEFALDVFRKAGVLYED